MPPKDSGEALPKEKIALIEQWIKEGAKLDAGIDAKADLLARAAHPLEAAAAAGRLHVPVTVTALAFTPDNKKLVVGGHHELTVWDAATGKLEKRICTRAGAGDGHGLPARRQAGRRRRPARAGRRRPHLRPQRQGQGRERRRHPRRRQRQGVLVKQLLDTDDAVSAWPSAPTARSWPRAAAIASSRLGPVGGYATAKLEQTIENHADWVFGVAFTPTASTC